MEDYKKKYEETIKKLKEAKESMGGYTFSSVVNKIIPELKESEDERIWTINYLNNKKLNSSIIEEKESLKKAIAWLEKQGEKNLSTDFSDLRTWKYIVDAVWTEKEGIGQYLDSPFTEETAKKLQKRFGNIEQKPADKVESKSDIEKGKWYVCNTPRYRDFVVGKAYYCPKNGMLKPNENEMARYVARNCFHLWTIQDAKEGDVLYHKSPSGIEYIVMSSGVNGFGNVDSYFRYNSVDGFDISVPSVFNTREDITPATKEQRDFLFQKMKEAGYVYDAEKKELKKIEQKSAWSEEDENYCLDVNAAVSDYFDEGYAEELKDWLKSLKEKVQPQPKREWSEKDEKMLDGVTGIVEDWYNAGSEEEKEYYGNCGYIDWLKSLKERMKGE